MAVTTLDQYNYSCFVDPSTNAIGHIDIIVDNISDPVISDIESKLIDSDNKAYLEGQHFVISDTMLTTIGSATTYVLEVGK